MKYLRLLALIAILFTPSASRCAADAQFNVTAYGAKGDGVTKNTSALQKAIDACATAGGGKVVFPKGKYLTGSITLRSNVELHLDEDATLLGSTLMADYPPHPFPKFRSLRDKGGFPALIYAEEAEHVTLTGPGTIDGQGAAFQPAKIENNEDIRPRGIVLISCKDVRVQGGLYLCNAGSWTQHYLNCENMEIHNIEVFGHVTANNDCIDIDGCRHVRVSGIRGDTYDDGITLKATGPSDCEDVVVEDCTIASHCAAIKCGTETTGGFKHICIKNISVVPSVAGKLVYGSRRGNAGIGLMIADGGTLDDVTISNVTIRGPRAPFYIRLGNRSRKYMDSVPEPPVGIVRNITLSDITISDVQSKCSWICGLPDHPVENVTLRNIRIVAPGFAGKVPILSTDEKAATYPGENLFFSQPASCIFIRHARNITLDHLTFATATPETRPPLLAVDVNGLVIRDAHASSPGERPVFLRGTGVTGLKFKVPKDWNGVGQELAP